MATLAAVPIEQFTRELPLLVPLVLHVVAMAIYAIFIFEFYKFVARRDMFDLSLLDYREEWKGIRNVGRVTLYFLQYVLLFPTLLIVWYLIFAFFVTLLSTGQSIDSVLLLTMAVVTTTRLTAYYNEDLSTDLAKMVPLSILGVFVVDGIEALSIDGIVFTIEAISDFWHIVALYWLFTVILEFFLRFLTIVQQGTLETVAEEDPTVEKGEMGEEDTAE